MARRRSPFRQKVRTWEHVIGDLAVNHVERQVYLCRFTVEPIRHDYGLDLILFTYDDAGQLEDGSVYLQVKGTERAETLKKTKDITWRVDLSDVRTWLRRSTPVVLIVYDVSGDRAYWLHVQDYFLGLPEFDLATATTLSVRIPPSQVLNPEAVRHFAALRDEALD